MLVALLLLSLGCRVTVNILWLFLTVSWLGLQCVIVVFPNHTYLLKMSPFCFSGGQSEMPEIAMDMICRKKAAQNPCAGVDNSLVISTVLIQKQQAGNIQIIRS